MTSLSSLKNVYKLKTGHVETSSVLDQLCNFLNLRMLLRRGVLMKAVFWLGVVVLMQISSLRFKQSRISMLIPHIYVLGRFVNFLVILRYIFR